MKECCLVEGDVAEDVVGGEVGEGVAGDAGDGEPVLVVGPVAGGAGHRVAARRVHALRVPAAQLPQLHQPVQVAGGLEALRGGEQQLLLVLQIGRASCRDRV